MRHTPRPPASGGAIAVLHQGRARSGLPIVENAWQLQADLVAALESLGWSASAVYLDDDFAWVHHLRALAPELVLNAADLGFRYDMTLEPLIAGTLDAAGLRYTGSGAYCCFLSSDKYTSKVVLASRGVPVARCWLEREAESSELVFPVLLKMRYGHNSYGIDASSVVGSREALLAKLRSRGPADAELVIEEYIDGPEATAGFVGDRPMPPFTIAWGPAFDGQPKILGTASKWDESSPEYQQSPSVPGDFSPALVAQMNDSLRRAADCLLVEDYGRCDFRLRTDADGREVAYAIDVNANPDLHRGAGLFRMATAAGLTYPEMVEVIVSSALARPPRRPAQGLDSGA